MATTIHVAADIDYGVYEIDPKDYPERTLTRFEDFLSQLPTLEEDELIFTDVVRGTPEYVQLQSEYGIR